MDLLLQAARVLELETTGDGADRVSSKSTRGAYFLQFAKSKNKSSDGSQIFNENGVSIGDEDIPLVEKTSRRVGGVATREVHNQLEKNRRKQLREFFSHLQQCVPSLENKRVATQSILQGAIKHIKNLKKKDVEQEREIQMLAKRKSELKKKYELEFNKCTEEQHRTADILLKVMKSDAQNVKVDQDERMSDSTSTASEGAYSQEDFSDNETESGHTQLTKNIIAESKNKRKQSARPGLDFKLFPGSVAAEVRPGRSQAPKASSSSVALKQMLEQRKRGQTVAVSSLSPSSSSSSQEHGGMPVTPPTSRVPGSLTYSYPMISTHLASALRPATSASCHVMSSMPAVSAVSLNTCASAQLTLCTSGSPPTTFASSSSEGSVKKMKKMNHAKSKVDVSTSYYKSPSLNSPSHKSSSSLYVSTSVSISSPQKLIPAPALSPSNLTPTVTVKTSTKSGNMCKTLTSAPHVVACTQHVDIANHGYIGKAAVGGHAGTSVGISQTLDAASSKLLPAIIPLSLTPLIPGLQVNSGLSHIVTLAPSPLTLSSSPSFSSSQSVTSSVLNSKLEPAGGGHFLLTSPVITERGSLPRIAAPPAHISSNMIKATSPVANVPSSSCRSTSIAIPVSLTPNFVSLSVASGPAPGSAAGTPVHILTPLPQNPATLTSSQSNLVSTVVQLETSGQVALLQNLIPGPHHILTQPFVVMTTPSSSLSTSSAGALSNVTTSLSSSPSSVL